MGERGGVGLTRARRVASGGEKKPDPARPAGRSTGASAYPIFRVPVLTSTVSSSSRNRD